MSQFFVNMNSAGGDVTSITGNSGTPATGAVGLVTANTTVKFVSGGSTVTQDFGLTNLLIGDSGASIDPANSATNVGIGQFALHSLFQGESNTATGYFSANALTTGSFNDTYGYSSGDKLTIGTENTFLGSSSGTSATSAANNVAVGNNALNSITTGIGNVSIGAGSGVNSTGSNSYNIIIGANVAPAGASNQIWIGNQGSGAYQQNQCYIAGIVGVTVANTQFVTINSSTGQLGVDSVTPTGFIQTITGNDSVAESPSSGNFNLKTANTTLEFIGTAATETLDYARTSNLLMGFNGSTITTASNNTATGYQCFNHISTGTQNSIYGFQCAQAINTGSYNCAFGSQTLKALAGSSQNSAFGNFAGGTNIDGGDNALFGYIAFQSAPHGSQNVVIGSQAGANILGTSSNNILIGYKAGSNYVLNESSNIVIGTSLAGVTSETNTLRLGQSGSGSGQQNKCFIAGIDGVSVGSTAQVVTEVSGQLGSAVLTAGTGVTITPTANVITISASSSGFTWTDVTTTTQTIAAENGYITDRSGGVIYTSPASGSLGDTFIIVGKSGLATITPLALQQLLIGSASGTVGITGTAVSTNAGDCITFVCITSGSSTVWRADSFVGNWTLT
jgi:trimeric autotransporter adhesin